MSSITRLSNPLLEEMGFDPIGLRQPITVNIEEQLVNTRQYFPDNGIEGQRIENLSVGKLKAGTLMVDTYIQSTGYVTGTTGWRIDGEGNAEFNSITLTGGTLRFGKTSFSDSTNAGYILDSNGVYVGSALDDTYIKYDIGGETFTIQAALITSAGSDLNGTYLGTNTVTSGKLNVAARGWTQNCAFSVTDADTVAWGTGTFTASDATAYSIGAGNTGNMSAKTYIYLDIGVSTTEYQVTTTASTAVGDGKVLIAVAQNNTTEAIFQVFGGAGGLSIDASSIVASSITANEIAASTITAGKLDVSELSAITADMGSITAGTITLDTSGYIRGGQTDYNTGTGFFLGYSGGAYKLSIGDTTTSNSLTWDGSLLSINGSSIANNDIFGSGVDGAFALDGTNTYATYFSKSGSTYTQLMDVFATTVTLSSSAIVITNGYRLFCKTSLTVASGCTIKWNGNNGSNGGDGGAGANNDAPGGTAGTAGSGGAALASASLYGSLAGLAGTIGGVGGVFGAANGNSVSGTAGTAITSSFASSFSLAGANGGTGGTGGGAVPMTQGSGGTGTGGATGTITASSVRPYNSYFAVDMFDKTNSATLSYLKYNGHPGGASGGGGGGAGSTGGSSLGAGGGGGGGGGNGSNAGTLVICAKTISNSGSIEANGGNGGAGGAGGAGGNAGGTDGGGGGGGGGGRAGCGGVIIVIYSTLTGAGTITANAGTAGAGGAAGTNSGGGNPVPTAATVGVTPSASSAGSIIYLTV